MRSCTHLTPVEDNNKSKRAPLTILQLISLLQVDEVVRTCHGSTKKGPRCTRQLSRESILDVEKLIKAVFEAHTLNINYAVELEELSLLVHCKRNHQDQAVGRLSLWTIVLQELSNNSGDTSSQNVKIKASPTSTTQFTRILDQKETEDIRNIAHGSRCISDIHTFTTRNTNVDISSNISQPVAHRTRSITQIHIPSHTFLEPSIFVPFSSHPTSTKLFVTRLLKPFTASEYAPGSVYIFSRSDTPGLFKIGYTKNEPAKRLSYIGRQCHYTPHLRFSIRCKHARRLESLVHKYFHKERRRETSGCGLCNNGRGCQTVHKEWFEVELNTVVRVLKMLAGWIDGMQPYENGFLRQSWVDKMKSVRVGVVDMDDAWSEYFLSPTIAVESLVDRRVPLRTSTTTAIKLSTQGALQNHTSSKPEIQSNFETSSLNDLAARISEKITKQVAGTVGATNRSRQAPASTLIYAPC